MAEDRFGDRLRNERERRKIALESVAEKTKISIGLLRELEHDQLTRWPPGIFRRSFIRAYAEAIGLDADQTLEEFLQHYPDAPAFAFEDVPVSALTAAAAMARLVKPERRLPATPAAMRLILADEPQPFVAGRLLRRIPHRIAAAAWDVSTSLLLALLVYLWLDRFWIPFAMILACYHAGSVLALGNTPGVYFFAPTHLTGRGEGSSQAPPEDDLAELPIFNPRGV